MKENIFLNSFFSCEVELSVLQPSWEAWPPSGLSRGKKRDTIQEKRAALHVFNTMFRK